MNEQEIIQFIRNRDEKGMEELLRHYGPLMRYVIAPILQNPEDREECLSDAAMRVWNGIEQFDPDRGKWNAWLTAIARNTALNRARKNAGETAQEIPPETPSQEISPEESVLKKERSMALVRALLQLSSNEKTLFYRKYYYMQSTEQIASEMGLSLRAVEGKLYRIKKKLRKMLGGEADD